MDGLTNQIELILFKVHSMLILKVSFPATVAAVVTRVTDSTQSHFTTIIVPTTRQEKMIGGN